MILRPLYDYVLIKRLQDESQDEGGIVIPDIVAEKPNKGVVVSIGVGRGLRNGKIRQPGVPRI